MYAQTYNKKYAVSYIYGATYFVATLDMHDVYDFLLKDENLFYYNEHRNYFFVISISFDVGAKLFSHFSIQEMNYATVFAKITTDWQAIKRVIQLPKEIIQLAISEIRTIPFLN